MRLPSISFIIPTYNEEKNIEICLNSIIKQTYPLEKIEIIIIDDDSKDNTISIVKKIMSNTKIKMKILNNGHHNAEFGKSIGIRNSNAEIIVLLDADNEIAQENWLRKMVTPLIKNPEIFGVESFYLHNKKEHFLNRYFTEIQLTDPLARCLIPQIEIKKKDGYLEYNVKKNQPPPIGANGFLWRRSIIEEIGGYTPKFEETNFTCRTINRGYNKYAKIEALGIHHYYVTGFRNLIKKRMKIGKKFLSRKEKKQNTWVDNVSKRKFIISIIFCSTFFGPLVEGIREYIKSKEKIWLLHPFMCLLTVILYGIAFLKKL
jgi:glycosyltransferase involved in cell wall biosynthesis